MKLFTAKVIARGNKYFVDPNSVCKLFVSGCTEGKQNVVSGALFAVTAKDPHFFTETRRSLVIKFSCLNLQKLFSSKELVAILQTIQQNIL